MDVVKEVPIEISLHIFSFLSFRDLITCFKVSRYWRDVANYNYLWKNHCLPYVTENEISAASISRVGRSRPTQDFLQTVGYSLKSRDIFPTRNVMGPLCGCAKLFKHKYTRHLCNWKNGNFKFSHVVLRENDPNLICSKDELTLCFYKNNMFGVIDMTQIEGEIEPSYLDIPVPCEEGVYDSIYLTSEYLLVSSKNIIMAYKIISGEYISYKTFILQNDNLETQDGRSFLLSVISRDKFFVVSFISGNFAWFRSPAHVYVVNLVTCDFVNKICIDNSHIKYGNNDKVVIWSKGLIKIFTGQGHLLHERQVRAQIREVAFEETFSLLCRAKKNTKAYIEWWDPQTAKRRVLKRVDGEIAMVVRGENVFILEVKLQSFHCVSAIHSISGITYWIHYITEDSWVINRLSESVIFESICGKYLFIHIPTLGNNKYYVIDMNSGIGLYSKQFGEGRVYLFNEKMVVIARGPIAWTINYL